MKLLISIPSYLKWVSITIRNFQGIRSVYYDEHQYLRIYECQLFFDALHEEYVFTTLGMIELRLTNVFLYRI